MTNWTSEEIDILNKNRTLSNKQVFEIYKNVFGAGVRTYNSITRQLRRIRNQRDDISRAASNVYPSTISYASLPEEPLPSDIWVPTPFPKPCTPAEKAKNTKDAQEWLRGLVKEQREYPDPLPARPVQSEISSLVITLSDLHFGKQTAQFSLSTGTHRLAGMAGQIEADIGMTVDEVVVLLIGDLVEGEDIYSNQNGQLACSVIEQTEVATTALWNFLCQLEEFFDCPVRVEAVPGNHGRMSKTATTESNWDNVICNNLVYLSGTRDRISVVKNHRLFKRFQVKDKIGAIYHEGVKHTGTPAMQIRLAGWITSKHLDFICSGHYHQWQVSDWLGSMIIQNGCLCGPDDLSEKMGKEGKARQGYFLVTPGQPLHNFSFIEW